METKHAKFLELLEPVKKLLLSYIRYLLWNKQDLEDALQNVLVEAYRKFGKFREGTSFKNWVFQIATFTVFNMNRRYRKLTTETQRIENAHSISSMPPWQVEDYQKLLAGSDRILEEISNKMKTSLILLNESERAIFLLRSLGELNYTEIAETLQIPLGSVMGNLARARLKLRKQLTNYAKEQGLL